MISREFRVIVIGGGHAGVEAAWAAANVFGEPASVALVTLDAATIGVMSCNPAIGGLAKGQIVREIDALNGLMGLAADATGIQFKVLNASKGAAVRGPRAQCDKHAYADAVQQLIASRPEITVFSASVDRLIVEDSRVRGVVIAPSPVPVGAPTHPRPSRVVEADVVRGAPVTLRADAVVLTTGTFMRGLMHTGESRTPGGRFGEAAATGISAALAELRFELGRLKTGTPPRLDRRSIDWTALEPARGDDFPTPFSDLSLPPGVTGEPSASWFHDAVPSFPLGLSARFPVLEQVECRTTSTTASIHSLIRENLHRAPMYSGQIESAGPRYCPSIEDKVVRFAQRDSHQVFLEPESLAPGHEHWVYCNGISTSLPADIQLAIVRGMPGCAAAEILRYGYAVEYDMVRPHQISASTMTKSVHGLFLAGQINGTSGYEEAAGQGLLAGLNAALLARGQDPMTLARNESYIGVMMDDLVTKTPVEPYRMFTSRAEHRLLLRADNAADRLHAVAARSGLLSGSLGRLRSDLYAARARVMHRMRAFLDANEAQRATASIASAIRRGEADTPIPEQFASRSETLAPAALAAGIDDPAAKAAREPATAGSRGLPAVPESSNPLDARAAAAAWVTVRAETFYETYIRRERAEALRLREIEQRRIPAALHADDLSHLRAEAREAIRRFRPETFGQASRLEGITPADLSLLAVLVKRPRPSTAG